MIRVGTALDVRWIRVRKLLDLRRIEKPLCWTHAICALGGIARIEATKN